MLIIQMWSLSHLLHCCFLAERLAFHYFVDNMHVYSNAVRAVVEWRCLTCLSEVMVSLLALLDSLYKAGFVGDLGLEATFGGKNTSPWSSFISTLAPPPPCLPPSSLMEPAAPSSSTSFCRLSASTCLIFLFSSRTRSISMKSSCTCSSLQVNAQIHVCACECWCLIDSFFFLFLGSERVCQHSGRSGFCIKGPKAPLCLWRLLLLQGPNGRCFQTWFLYMVSFLSVHL